MYLYEALAKVAVCLFKVKATDGTPAAMNANGFLSVLRLALVFGCVISDTFSFCTSHNNAGFQIVRLDIAFFPYCYFVFVYEVQ